MCKVNEKTYVYPNGEEQLIETVNYCSKSKNKTLCNSYERIPMGPFFVHDPEPSLVVDDGYGTPSSSGGNPPTPLSTAGLEYRSPSSVERHPSRSKRSDASKLKISFHKGKRDSHQGHHGSSPSSSGGSSGYRSHSRQPSANTVPTTPPLGADIPERTPASASPTSTTAVDGRRRRMRTVVDQDLQPNPPPGSSSDGSSLSGRGDPRVSGSDRQRAQAESSHQQRQHRRDGKARATEPQPDGREASDREKHEAREKALDDQARREWERGNHRERLRAEAAAHRADEERGLANPERRYTLPNQDQSGVGRRRRSSATPDAFIDQLRRMTSSDEPIDDAESQRRQSTLMEQLRTSRPAQEGSRSNSDNSDRIKGQRTDQKQAHSRHSYTSGSYHGSHHPPVSSPTLPSHRSPPMAYDTRYSTNAESNRRSWHESDVSARNPMPQAPTVPQRRSSVRRPSTSSGRPTSAMLGGVARPESSSSRNNAAWTSDPEAFRRRGEQVLDRAQARGAQQSRAQEASWRMSDAMYSDYEGEGYDYTPDEYYRDGGR